MVLETPRILLRPLTVADATQAYADWLNDPEVNRYLETRFAIQTRDSCRTFIEQTNADPDHHLFGIFLKGGDTHVGNAKLGFINSHHRSGQISLFIGDKGQWGKGLAREVVHAITAHGFQDLALERIEAGCYEDNLASLRVFLNVGYTVEGFFRKSVIRNGNRSGSFWLGMLKHEFV